MRLRAVPRWLRGAVGPLLLLALWQVLSATGVLHADVLASPGTIARAGSDLIADGTLPSAMRISLQRVAVGLALGGVAGTALALVSGLSRLGEDPVDASVHMLRTVPWVGLIPLFIIRLGIGEAPRVALIALGVAFHLYLNVYAGIRGVEVQLIESGESLGLGRWGLIRHVVLPGALPGAFDGEHYQVEGGLTALPPDPLPDIFFGGSSAAAGPVAAAHADVYLTWGEPPAAVKEKIGWIRGLAEEQGRTVRFGIRLHTISRDSSREAWATADRLLGDLDPETVAAAQQALGRSESVGQQRMLALHGGSRDKLEISPNLWAGVGPVRGGAGTALVGSHAEVADRIEEYHALGVEHFVLSGYPHLEEAYWFGEGVTPELAARGLLSTVPASPLLGVPAANGRPASAPGGAPLLVAGGR